VQTCALPISLLLHNTTFKSKLSIQKLFIIHFAVSRSLFTQTATLAYYTVCKAQKSNLARKRCGALKWVCAHAINNAFICENYLYHNEMEGMKVKNESVCVCVCV